MKGVVHYEDKKLLVYLGSTQTEEEAYVKFTNFFSEATLHQIMETANIGIDKRTRASLEKKIEKNKKKLKEKKKKKLKEDKKEAQE